MRRVTVIVEELDVLGDASAKAEARTTSNTYGHGTVVDHVASVTKILLKMWEGVDPQSVKPKTTGHPKPAPPKP